MGCLGTAQPGLAQEQPDVAGTLPYGHWSIDALKHLANKDGLKSYEANSLLDFRRWTRYEVAVAIMRLSESMNDAAPNPLDTTMDALTARDILVALNYEYRDELMVLGLRDPMTNPEFEAYLQTKLQHPMNASEWYIHNKDEAWNKDYQENLRKVILSRKLPPRLTITPSILLQTGINAPENEEPALTVK